MIKEYLKHLKASGNFSWQDISSASGLPEATIRKIFSGETADPRFETVERLVNAMGGSLDKIHHIEKVEKAEDSSTQALATVKEVYESRIRDIKENSAEHIRSLKRDKKLLTVAVCALAVVLIGVLLFDLFIGSAGWVRY